MGWYRQYVRWHGKRHPAEMGATEVEKFLTHLPVNRGCGGDDAELRLRLRVAGRAHPTISFATFPYTSVRRKSRPA